MSGTVIPQRSRDLVRARAHGRCERCGIPAPIGNGQWHHRRSRRVVDEHRHHPCNGVWLCAGCHRQVHRQPEEESKAKAEGFVLSQWVANPGDLPVTTPWGVRTNDCDGGYHTVS